MHICLLYNQPLFIFYSVDNDDQDLVLFNRCMLPAYYGLLRMSCAHSRTFTRQLASHQNIQWAFRFITPFPAQYNVVCIVVKTLLTKSYFTSQCENYVSIKIAFYWCV